MQSPIFSHCRHLDVVAKATEYLDKLSVLGVPDEEAAAANALLIKDVVIIPKSFPKTEALLKQ